MRALGAAMALSCAVVLVPSAAYADHIGAREGKYACALNLDGPFVNGERSERLSVAAVSSDGQASASERSPDLEGWRDGDNSGPHHGLSLDDDVLFGERGSLENSAFFANHGSSQVFADDRSSFRDEISFDGFAANVRGHVISALRKHHGNEGHGNGRALVPQGAAAPTPNPEPASMLLLGTGLAGLVRYRRRLFS